MSFIKSFRSGALVAIILGGGLFIGDRLRECSAHIRHDYSTESSFGTFKGNEGYASEGPQGIGRRVTIYFNRASRDFGFVEGVDSDLDGKFERVRYAVPQEKVERTKVEYNDKVLNEAWDAIIKEKKPHRRY